MDTAEPRTEAGRALLTRLYRTSPDTPGMDDPRYVTYLAGRQRILDAILTIETEATATDDAPALRAALVALVGTLESIEFRANVFGLTMSQEDSRRLAKTLDDHAPVIRATREHIEREGGGA